MNKEVISAKEQNKLVALGLLDNQIKGISKSYILDEINELDKMSPNIEIDMVGVFKFKTPFSLSPKTIKRFNKLLQNNSYRVPSVKQIQGEDIVFGLSYSDNDKAETIEDRRQNRFHYFRDKVETTIFNYFVKDNFIKSYEVKLLDKFSDCFHTKTDEKLYKVEIQHKERKSSNKGQFLYNMNDWYFVGKKEVVNPTFGEDFIVSYLVRNQNVRNFYNYPSENEIKDSLINDNKLIAMLNTDVNFENELVWNRYTEEPTDKFLRDDVRFKDKITYIDNPEYEKLEFTDWGYKSGTRWLSYNPKTLVTLKE